MEIHSHYRDQIEIARQVDWVYDFALPPLVLHALYTRDATRLEAVAAHQSAQRGHGARHARRHRRDRRRAGAGRRGRRGCCRQRNRRAGRNDSRAQQRREPPGASGAAASNLDFSGELHLLRCPGPPRRRIPDRASAFSSSRPAFRRSTTSDCWPGANDMDLLRRTRRRARHQPPLLHARRKCSSELERPVVRALLELIRFRNTHPAFGGEFRASATSAHRSPSNGAERRRGRPAGRGPDGDARRRSRMRRPGAAPEA